MDPFEEYKKNINRIHAKKKRIVQSILKLSKKFIDLESEEEKLSDEEFARANVIIHKHSFNLSTTEEEMMEDLIKRTEGIMITPDKPNLN